MDQERVRPASWITRMPLVVSAVLLSLLVAGCGESDGNHDGHSMGTSTQGSRDAETTQPDASGGSTTITSAPAAGNLTPVEIVHAPRGGGSTDGALSPLTTTTQVNQFVADLSPELSGKVRTAVDNAGSAPAGQVLVGQVVSVGCDVPESVAITDGRLVPDGPKSKNVQCMVEMTGVAVVFVDESLI